MTVRGLGCVVGEMPGRSEIALSIHDIEDRRAAGDT